MNSPEYAPAKALIRHTLISHILSLVMYVNLYQTCESDEILTKLRKFNMLATWKALCSWTPTFDQILKTAEWIVENFTTSVMAEAARELPDDYLARVILFHARRPPLL